MKIRKLIDQAREYADTTILDAAAAYVQAPDRFDHMSFASVGELEMFLEKYLDAASRSSTEPIGVGSGDRSPDCKERISTTSQLLSCLTSILGLGFYSSSSRKASVENDEQGVGIGLDDEAKRNVYCLWYVYRSYFGVLSCDVSAWSLVSRDGLLILWFDIRVRTLFSMALAHRINLRISGANDELTAMASLAGAFLLRKEVKLDYFTSQHVYDVAIAFSSGKSIFSIFLDFDAAQEPSCRAFVFSF